MRFCTIAFVLVLAVAVSLRAEDQPAPATQPASVDLNSNPLVQKALADQDKGVTDTEADYAKKLEALKAERQKKLDAIKTACVAALHRAAAVSNARNKKDEAETIKALADSIQSEVTAMPPSKPKVNPFVGKWVDSNGHTFILSPDKTAVADSGGRGTWEDYNDGIVVHWEINWTDCLRPNPEGGFTRYGFSGKSITGRPTQTSPARKLE